MAAWRAPAMSVNSNPEAKLFDFIDIYSKERNSQVDPLVMLEYKRMVVQGHGVGEGPDRDLEAGVEQDAPVDRAAGKRHHQEVDGDAGAQQVHPVSPGAPAAEVASRAACRVPGARLIMVNIG